MPMLESDKAFHPKAIAHSVSYLFALGDSGTRLTIWSANRRRYQKRLAATMGVLCPWYHISRATRTAVNRYFSATCAQSIGEHSVPQLGRPLFQACFSPFFVPLSMIFMFYHELSVTYLCQSLLLGICSP
jgi:hypothetical protein